LTKDQWIAADALAQFAELKPEEVENFRHTVYRGFVPDPWWSLQGQRMRDWKRWQEMQALLQSTWDSGFPVSYTLSFLLNNFSTATEPESFLTPTDIFRALPYQEATMFLFNESWRARRCNRQQCRKRFVAMKPNDQYCSDDCKTIFRKQYKAAHIREKRKRIKRNQTKRGGR
jgi:hypothetical protein